MLIRDPQPDFVLMPNILDEIVAHKRVDIVAAKRARPLAELEDELAAAPPVRDFAAALRAKHPMGLIAEVKRASPSAGLIREDFDPVRIAQIYERHGAGCISVLTDEQFFQGSLQYLWDIRGAVSVPLLRKDFVLDRYQVFEARAAGADCVLLIAECLAHPTLVDLHECIVGLGMQALVEIYDPDNLERALDLNPALLGINNRNLRTFVTDLDHSIRLRSRVPDDVLLVSESGINAREDLVRLQDAGIHAILVGETLMRADDIGSAVDKLLT